MNLALKDIGFAPTRFLLAVAGVGLLVTAAIGMVGLYRGVVADALLLIEDIGAELWVVQGERAGPFSEASSIPVSLDRRVDGVPGVARTRRFLQLSEQFEVGGRRVQAAVVGLDVPEDDGAWIRLIAGRPLGGSRYEAVADRSLGLDIGDTVRLGRDDYRVVGIARGMVDLGGDGILFVGIRDAIDIAERRSSEEVRLARSRAAGLGDGREAKVSAVLVGLDPAVAPTTVRAAMMSWGDVNVLDGEDQFTMLLDQRLWRLRLQILAFTIVLLVVLGIVVSLIVYTMTIEKLHQIAMLKLIGARDRFIVAMICQQAGLMAGGGFVVGLLTASVLFPHFPRRVLIEAADVSALVLVLALVTACASLVGIARAGRVRAQEVLA